MKELLKEIVLNKNGPIIVIEDDSDDQNFLAEIFDTLNYQNKIFFFSDGEEALNYINQSSEPPFLILSDINLPRLNGFELRDKLKTDAKLSNKCIPYLFFRPLQIKKLLLMLTVNPYKAFLLSKVP